MDTSDENSKPGRQAGRKRRAKRKIEAQET
jgi:hypothetical protein